MLNIKNRSVLLLIACALPACAQYPGHVDKTKKAAPPMRSIAVLEWTGDMGKPKASRIIPISVFDGETYQPGGLYLAKPEPLALEPGTEYVLQDAGVARGLFDVSSAQDMQGYWFGFGKWKPMATPPAKRAKPKQGARMPQVVTDNNDGRPHFKGRQPGTDPDKADSDKPASADASAASSRSSSAPPSDPDRPTLRKRADSTDSASSTATAETAAAPETAVAGGDPDRPHIAHGQQSQSEADTPAQLTGVPSSLQQMIAVSDANDHAVHPFIYLWPDPEDAVKMQAQMQLAAASAIAAAQPAAKAAPKPRVATSTTQRHRAAAAAPSKATPVFTNEHFKAFELTYSGGATLVYSAETTDHAGKTKYVTLIAQPDFNGVPRILFKSVTDDDHLDQTPRMKLVDAVDARANNRGDLIFELRSQHDREFVIYRISAGLAEQVFTTGTLPNSIPNSQS